MVTKFNYIKGFVKSCPSVLNYKLFKKKKNLTKFNGKKDITIEYSDQIIKEFLNKKEPFCAIRFGAVELSCWNNYLKKKLKFKSKYKKSVKYSIKNSAGVFPVTENVLDSYSNLCLSKLGDVDILGISGLHMEEYFAKQYCPNAAVIQNWSLEPLIGTWTKHLKGKKVLVVSPFAKQIEKQYLKRKKLFLDNEEILPDFKLETIEPPFTMLEETSSFESWLEAFDDLCKRIKEKDFDIALVGCGAYGTPLCLYIKSLGKQALQTGGATQTLFGIIGKRWENREHVVKYINEDWERPNFVPNNKEKFENGAYW